MFDNLTVGRVINHAQQRIDLHPLERSQTSGLGEFVFQRNSRFVFEFEFYFLFLLRFFVNKFLLFVGWLGVMTEQFGTK
jgi:hypothetical protein